ncbi:MAG: hypothetical protein ACLSIL_17695 [Enterococcus casseliflavus]
MSATDKDGQSSCITDSSIALAGTVDS